jgi:hypothetical protein
MQEHVSLSQVERSSYVDELWKSFLSEWNKVLYAQTELDFWKEWREFQQKYADFRQIILYVNPGQLHGVTTFFIFSKEQLLAVRVHITKLSQYWMVITIYLALSIGFNCSFRDNIGKMLWKLSVNDQLETWSFPVLVIL